MCVFWRCVSPWETLHISWSSHQGGAVTPYLWKRVTPHHLKGFLIPFTQKFLFLSWPLTVRCPFFCQRETGPALFLHLILRLSDICSEPEVFEPRNYGSALTWSPNCPSLVLLDGVGKRKCLARNSLLCLLTINSSSVLTELKGNQCNLPSIFKC